MRFVARHPLSGARLLDIAENVELERPTAHRLLQTLAAEGLVEQDAARRYRVGPLIFELSLMSGGYFNLVNACIPILEELAAVTGDTSFLFVRHGDEAVCLARKQGSYHIQTPVVAVNSCHPLGVSAGGLAILSAFPEEKARAVLDAVTPRLHVYKGLTSEEVWSHYCDAQKRGISVIADRVAPGVKGVGVAIKNGLGNPIAAVTVASTISRISDERVAIIAPMLHAAADKIGNEMRLHFSEGCRNLRGGEGD